MPAKIVYLTDGRLRTIHIGSQAITFKRTSPKELLPDKKTALVVHSLTDQVNHKLRKILSPAERKRLLREAKYASTWVPEAVRRIAEEPCDG